MPNPEIAQSIGISEIKYFDDAKITIIEDQPVAVASAVAQHETAHTYAAIEEDAGLQVVSIIPDAEQGSLGHVITKRPNGRVAMAAKAFDHDGTGYDEWVGEQIGNPAADEAAIKTKLTPKLKEMNRFALVLDDEREMTGGRAYELHDKLERTTDVIVMVEKDGVLQRVKAEAENGQVAIKKEWLGHRPQPKTNRWYNNPPAMAA